MGDFFGWALVAGRVKSGCGGDGSGCPPAGRTIHLPGDGNRCSDRASSDDTSQRTFKEENLFTLDGAMALRGFRRTADSKTAVPHGARCRPWRAAAFRTSTGRRWVVRRAVSAARQRGSAVGWGVTFAWAATIAGAFAIAPGVTAGSDGNAKSSVGTSAAPEAPSRLPEPASQLPERPSQLPEPAGQLLEPPGQLGAGWWKPRAAATGWQPRPVRLPGTGNQPVESLPDPFGQADPQPVTTIVIQMPEAAAPPVASSPVASPAEDVRPPAARITRPRPAELWQRKGGSEPRTTLEPSHPITAAARSSQLAESAVDLLRRAHWSARRGAIHSARDAAWETLRTLAALRDTQAEDNRHTVWLTEATTAIQESADFNGRFGPVDPAALSRLIEVHETEVLHGVDTKTLTPARAVEAYLDWAQQRLVAAVGGGPLATEATIILADLQVSDDGLLAGTEASPRQAAFHAAELALMYRRAAFQIDPQHPAAAAGLGRTLLARSLPEMAKPYLRRSVAAAATRQNVQSLLRAAELTDDVLLAQQCRRQLQKSELPSELPVAKLSPEQFAATHATLGGQTRLVERTSGGSQGSAGRHGLRATEDSNGNGNGDGRSTARVPSAGGPFPPRVARRQQDAPIGSDGLSGRVPSRAAGRPRPAASHDKERQIVDPARDVSPPRRGWFW